MFITREAVIMFLIVVNCDFVAIMQNAVKDDELEFEENLS